MAWAPHQTNGLQWPFQLKLLNHAHPKGTLSGTLGLYCSKHSYAGSEVAHHFSTDTPTNRVACSLRATDAVSVNPMHIANYV